MMAVTAGFLLGFLLIASIQFGTALEKRRVAATRMGLRQVAIALNTYMIDNMSYPIWGNMEANTVDRRMGKPPARPSTTFQLQDGSSGARFGTLTTPIMYLKMYSGDPFAPDLASFRYYNDTSDGFIIGSFGPDRDSATGGDLGWDKPTSCTLTLSTRFFHGPRYGPVPLVTDFDEEPPANGVMTVSTRSSLAASLFTTHGVAAIYSHSRRHSDPYLQVGTGIPGGDAFAYDPTNGLVSPGDIFLTAQSFR